MFKSIKLFYMKRKAIIRENVCFLLE